MMSTAVARPHPVGRPTASRDRVFYTGMAVLMALTVFAGFARTFYLRAYRVVVRDGRLRLERLKAPPAELAPIVVDTFTG